MENYNVRERGRFKKQTAVLDRQPLVLWESYDINCLLVSVHVGSCSPGCSTLMQCIDLHAHFRELLQLAVHAGSCSPGWSTLAECINLHTIYIRPLWLAMHGESCNPGCNTLTRSVDLQTIWGPCGWQCMLRVLIQVAAQ